MSSVTSLIHEIARLRALPTAQALKRLDDLELDAMRLAESTGEGMGGADAAGLLRQIHVTRAHLSQTTDEGTDANPDAPTATRRRDPTTGRLAGRRVAFLVTDGFEQSELQEPMEAVRNNGGHAVVVSPTAGSVRSWSGGEWSDRVDVDATLDEAMSLEFDGLVLPGGVMSPDRLRTDERVQAFILGFFELGRPVAAICHGPWLLAEVDVVKNRTVTSWPSLQTDLRNAGAKWVDEPVVVDAGLITSRNPDDLPVFCAKIVEEIAEGYHRDQTLATA